MKVDKQFQSIISQRNDRFKKELKNKPTPAEKIVFNILKKIEIKFKFQKGFWITKGKYKGYHCIVDFYIQSLRLAIEVDGGYHNLDDQKRKDNFKDKWLRENRGVEVLRIKNDDVKQIIEMINIFLYNHKRIKNCNYKYWEEKLLKYKKLI